MKARFFALGCLALVLAAGGLALWCHLDREPEYNGRPLSYWLDQTLTGEFRDGTLETFNALKSIGPPAAGPLVRGIALTDPPVRRYYTGLRSKLPASLNTMLPRERLLAKDARINALCALNHMGREARGQLPELIRLLKHPDKQARINATLVLAGIGPDARPAIPALLRDAQDPGLSNYVSLALSRIQGKNQTGPEK